MFLIVIEKVADTSWMIALAFVFQAISFQYMSYCKNQLHTDLLPPDYRFGYTYEDLYEFYDAIGPEGCEFYKKHALVDLFPYMQTYALIGGAFLLNQLRPLNWNAKVALIFPMAMVMDIIETIIPAHGCNLYFPGGRKLSKELVEAAASANQLKWTQFGLGMTLLSVLFLYNSIRPPVKEGETERGGQDISAKKEN